MTSLETFEKRIFAPNFCGGDEESLRNTPWFWVTPCKIASEHFRLYKVNSPLIYTFWAKYLSLTAFDPLIVCKLMRLLCFYHHFSRSQLDEWPPADLAASVSPLPSCAPGSTRINRASRFLPHWGLRRWRRSGLPRDNSWAD